MEAIDPSFTTVKSRASPPSVTPAELAHWPDRVPLEIDRDAVIGHDATIAAAREHAATRPEVNWIKVQGDVVRRWRAGIGRLGIQNDPARPFEP